MLKGKCIVIGVTGGIACYKVANLVSMLKKSGADVNVIMTKNATQFISPLTFETLSGNKCVVDTFEKKSNYNVEHISLAKKADIIMVAPATANVIAKMANGISDDMLTTTILASKCKKIIAPAMNTNMYENKITQDNIKKLKYYDFEVIEPAVGLLACNDNGIGKMPEPNILFEYILKEIAFEKTMLGKNILISAGATCEYIDPVRYITNPSSGKMGFALAKVCMLKGANVTLVCGKTTAPAPMFTNIINTISAEDMFNIFKDIHKNFDIIFMTAAVSDFTPLNVHKEKVKKHMVNDNTLQLKQTKDILKYLGENKPKSQILCGFSMETENLLENSKLKLTNKNLDYIVANNLKEEGAGFNVDTNIATLISSDNYISFGKLTKFELANKIINTIINNGDKND
ncbi:bifunctional phosphopantothenoylcysteine decarboxylase/phosphopantothenate--cysteine ligase CoaBC [uncultured Tyzzerella sp.]|uniref:bifunctional phosphopantothenoylcysteine decarboxylase/phosphopantothenate--cysteine ligase CoaBC n=1 Tax=uncultured Tyzzerella sp. TaxID=2321398 RepID=UPI002941C9FD|nr:bifunctional phosphopantothenoylcysteine decarboxylase/phosphopantothenate--cysteine ligase CoaBC [uncultured Tyzzerella sp.]